MKFLLDHDVAADLAVVLRTRGHDVVELRDVLAPDTLDPDIWVYAQAQKRILISCNRAHFIALATATERHPGLILLFRRPTHQSEASKVLALLKSAGEQGLVNNITFA